MTEIALRRGDEPGKEDARTQILTAAADAFVAGGFAGTSIDDVAEVLSATKGLIYHYYKSKSDLYLAVLQRGVEGLLGTLEAVAGQPIAQRDKLIAMVRAHATYFLSERQSMQLLAQSLFSGFPKTMSDRQRTKAQEIEASRARIFNLYLDLVDVGVQQGEFVDLPADAVTRMILGGIIFATLNPDHLNTNGHAGTDVIATFMARAIEVPRRRRTGRID